MSTMIPVGYTLQILNPPATLENLHLDIRSVMEVNISGVYQEGLRRGNDPITVSLQWTLEPNDPRYMHELTFLVPANVVDDTVFMGKTILDLWDSWKELPVISYRGFSEVSAIKTKPLLKYLSIDTSGHKFLGVSVQKVSRGPAVATEFNLMFTSNSTEHDIPTASIVLADISVDGEGKAFDPPYPLGFTPVDLDVALNRMSEFQLVETTGDLPGLRYKGTQGIVTCGSREGDLLLSTASSSVSLTTDFERGNTPAILHVDELPWTPEKDMITIQIDRDDKDPIDTCRRIITELNKQGRGLNSPVPHPDDAAFSKYHGLPLSEAIAESKFEVNAPDISDAPVYRSVKSVRALHIVGIDPHEVDPQLYKLKLEGIGTGAKYQDYIVSSEWLQKRGAQVGGALVSYQDGYMSYSPMNTFKAGHIEQQSNTEHLTPFAPYSLLVNSMLNDPEVAWGWLCNLACPLMDAGLNHKDANIKAYRQFQHLFRDVDLSELMKERVGIDVNALPQEDVVVSVVTSFTESDPTQGFAWQADLTLHTGTDVGDTPID